MEPENPPAFVFRPTEISIAAEKVWLDGLLSHAPDARGWSSSSTAEPAGAIRSLACCRQCSRNARFMPQCQSIC